MTDRAREPVSLSAKVAEEIRALMARRMMNQAELASKLGVSEMWVSRKLKGKQTIDLDEMAQIAAALGVAAADLMPQVAAEVLGADEVIRSRPLRTRPARHEGSGAKLTHRYRPGTVRPRGNRPGSRPRNPNGTPSTRRPVKLPRTEMTASLGAEYPLAGSTPTDHGGRVEA